MLRPSLQSHRFHRRRRCRGDLGRAWRPFRAAARWGALTCASDARRRRAKRQSRGLRQAVARSRGAADGLRAPRIPRRGSTGASAAAHVPGDRLARFEVAEALEKAALAELQARKPDRVLATNVEFWSAVTLDHAGVPPELFTPMFSCARVAGWSAHILEQKREGRLIRPTARYVGPAPRPITEVPKYGRRAPPPGRRLRLVTGRAHHTSRDSSKRTPRSGRPRGGMPRRILKRV